ncbi:MAG: hypothetical protein LBS40_05800 [Burkholderiales bacterium]|nr:hypothetical protein [Burkholderiales bacterium]
MTYQTSDFRGDKDYSIECTGDCVVGDEVAFDRATFSGSFRSAKFAGFERVEGKIIRDSYGRDKQQHTFTILLNVGGEMRIKGRNLYDNGTWRKPWTDEATRKAAQEEKHERGDAARKARDRRREDDGYFF